MRKILFVFLLFLALDSLMILLHFLWGGKFSFFNLDDEYTVSAYFQGLQLILVACSAFGLIVADVSAAKKNRRLLPVLAPYVFGFAYLALDEVGQIHEHLGQLFSTVSSQGVAVYTEKVNIFHFNQYALWIIFYLPFFLLGVAYLIYLISYFYKRDAKKFYLFAIAAVLFILVPAMEYLNTSNAVLRTPRYAFFMPLEEFMEMLGGTLFITFNLSLLSEVVKASKSELPGKV